ncbi:VanZ family protein [bacterium]|nr:VanZ family protein [bacterium]
MLIFFLSSLPQSELPPIHIKGFDKVLHFIEYLVYGMTLLLAYTHTKSPYILRNAFVVSMLTGILYAVTDEIHQLYVIGRDCSFGDFSVDVLGVVLGIFLFSKIIKYYNPEDEMLFQHSSHK